MSNLSIDWDGEKILKISGPIDELAVFEPYIEQFNREVWIDMGGVTRINSGGVRQWAKAVSVSHAIMHYINVPPPIVDQMVMVIEFLGPGGVVDSFLANYNCNSCGNNPSYLFTVGVDIEKHLEDYGEGPIKMCPKCGEQMEIDHNPDLYFEFLKLNP